MQFDRKAAVIKVMKKIWGKHKLIEHHKDFDIFVEYLEDNLYLFDGFNEDQIKYTHKTIMADRKKSNFLEKPELMTVVKYADAAPKPIEEPPPEPTPEEEEENRAKGIETCASLMEFLDKDSPSSPMQSSFMSDKEDV